MFIFSHVSSGTLGMVMSVGRFTLFGPDLNCLKYELDFHDIWYRWSQEDVTESSDPLTLPVAPPGGQSFKFSCEISQHLRYGLAQNVWSLETFVTSRLFL